MIPRLIRAVCMGLARLFYRRIAVFGAERVPAGGPVIVVANHPNGLIDPLLVALALGRPVAFLGKSTLFKGWLGKNAMQAFDALPLYRAQEADTRQNEETFALCRALLARKGWIALFPEGVSHSAPRLQPLKTGAARIALSAEAGAGFGLGVQILPLGLAYEAKEVFRSRVTVTVGKTFSLAPFAEAFARDERACVQALTERMLTALREVVLEADTHALLAGFRALAAWTLRAPGAEAPERSALRHEMTPHDRSKDEAAPDPRAAAHAHALTLAKAYERLSHDDPDEAERLAAQSRGFVRLLEAAGVRDPFAFDRRVPKWHLTGATLLLAALAPLALLGALLAYLPYRAIGPLARKIAAGETDLVSTIKALLGLLILSVTYTSEAIAFGWWRGWPAALVLLVLGPASGFAALRFAERWRLRRELLRAASLKRRRLGAAIDAHREALRQAFSAALQKSAHENAGAPPAAPKI